MADDTMSIFEWWMRPAESLSPAISFLVSPSYEWPDHVRKSYVLTWPLTAPLRLVAILGLMLLHVALGGCGYICAALNCIWIGKRNPWQ